LIIPLDFVKSKAIVLTSINSRKREREKERKREREKERKREREKERKRVCVSLTTPFLDSWG
jgi:hypothetical protein